MAASVVSSAAGAGMDVGAISASLSVSLWTSERCYFVDPEGNYFRFSGVIKGFARMPGVAVLIGTMGATRVCLVSEHVEDYRENYFFRASASAVKADCFTACEKPGFAPKDSTGTSHTFPSVEKACSVMRRHLGFLQKSGGAWAPNLCKSPGAPILGTEPDVDRAVVTCPDLDAYVVRLLSPMSVRVVENL